MTDSSKLAAALVAFQSELKPVDKNAENPFFKSSYMTLSNIMTKIQPILEKNKLAVVQMISSLDGQTALRTRVLHESGEFIEDTMPLLLAKEDPQAQGSAVTYARRYALCAALGIVADEDDDGNKATESYKPEPKSAPTATDKQIKTIYDTVTRLTGMDNKEDIDKWLEEKTGATPDKLSVKAAGTVITKLFAAEKARKAETRPDFTPDDVADVTDQDIADLKAGKVPY